MTPSIELQVISRLLTSQDQAEIDRLCSYDSTYYQVFNEEIEFIFNHKDKHGKVPDTFTFLAQFEDVDIIDVDEPLSYLEEGLKKNKQHILFLETYNKLADLGTADISEAWEYLANQCEKASQLDASKPMDIVHEAQERADQIIDFNKQARIPTGFKEIDEIMYGGLSTVEELLVIVARTNSGKAQPLWSKVLTPSGWTTMGELKVGDKVIGENNDVGEVVSLFPQGVKPYYRVTFDDGTYAECCDDHLWKVVDNSIEHESMFHKDFEVLRLEEIRKNLDKRYSVDITEPVNFDTEFDVENEIDGYTLGKIISNIDAPKYHRRSRKDTFIKHKLQEYDLSSTTSSDVFIPNKYFTAPIAVRLNLLAGLVDSQGYLFTYGSQLWGFRCASKQLGDDFCELVRSLGVKVKVNEFADISSLNPRYHFTCKSTFNPFWHSKAASKFFPFQRDNITRYPSSRNAKTIESVTYLGETECQCILLDNESHTYITDNYITTHNSWIGTKLMESAQSNGFPVLYYSPEMQSSFIGTRFDTWRGHYKNSELFRGRYSDEYKAYITELTNSETNAVVVEDSDMSEGRVTVRGLESLVRRYHSKLLIIDGLSYIASTGRYQNESLRYKDICNDLFRLSKTYGCAVVATVQANRETKENRDENGEPFPNIYTIAESDHPARIATQVFALRQLYEKHIIELRLEKSRNARNEKPVLAYSVDFNSGNLEFVSSQTQDSLPSSESFKTPIVSTQITQHLEAEPEIIDDEDYEGVEF